MIYKPTGSKTWVVGRVERTEIFIYNYREMFNSCQKVRQMMCNLNDNLNFIGPKKSLSGGVVTSQVLASASVLFEVYTNLISNSFPGILCSQSYYILNRLDLSFLFFFSSVPLKFYHNSKRKSFSLFFVFGR